MRTPLKAWLEENAVTNRELTRRVNRTRKRKITEQRIGQIASGESPSPPLARKIAKVTGLSEMDLLYPKHVSPAPEHEKAVAGGSR